MASLMTDCSLLRFSLLIIPMAYYLSAEWLLEFEDQLFDSMTNRLASWLTNREPCCLAEPFPGCQDVQMISEY